MNASLAESCAERLEQPQRAARHLLHVFASFGNGGVPIRICDVINGLGNAFRHTVVSLDGCFDAARRLIPRTAVTFLPLSLPRYNLPHGLMMVRQLLREAAPDVLLTYNWGAIEPALANRLLAGCAHIHFESGFGAEEGSGQLWRRNLFRRISLGRVHRVVVPSITLMEIASAAWSVPPDKLLRIPNGVDLRRYGAQPGKRVPLPRWQADPEEIVIGTVAPLRPEKNVGRLLHAFASLPGERRCRLLIAGDGAQREELRRLAGQLEIADLTCFLGHVEDVPAVLSAIDIFALSSDTEQMPNSLLQAMAAGRPIVAMDVGDVARIVAAENRPLVVPRDQPSALTGGLAVLVRDAALRETLGRLNQERVREQYSLEGMVAAYADLLDAAMGSAAGNASR